MIEKFGDKKDRKTLKLLFQKVMDFLKDYINKNNVQLSLFYGSLLGYTREKNFIENDDDIDAIIDIKHRDSLKKYCIENSKKYDIKIGINKDGIIQLFYKDIGPFDIYFYKDIPNTNDVYILWDGNPIFSKDDLLEFKKVIFHDREIFIPKNNEKILEQYYGKSWKTPQNFKGFLPGNKNSTTKFYKEKSEKNIWIIIISITIIIIILTALLIFFRKNRNKSY